MKLVFVLVRLLRLFDTGEKMTNYAQLAENIAAVERLGDWIAKSGMFGCTNPSQGFVIACDLFITGMPVMEYQKRNMMVQGNPSLPYDAMIAAFQEDGGKVKVISKTPDLAAIELTYQGETTKFSLSWDEAQKEPFVYNGKEADAITLLAEGKQPKLKAKYATPRSRAIMLYARCVSDGIRTVAAKVNFGAYTPEEIEDFGGGNVSATSLPTVPPPAAIASALTASSVASAAPTAAPVPVQTEQPKPSAEIFANRGDVLPATPEQKESIISLMRQLAQLGQKDIQQRIVAKLEQNGIQGGVLGLTHNEAAQLIKALENKNLNTWAEMAIMGHEAASKKAGNA